MKRIKTINSHTGLARFLAETTEIGRYLPRRMFAAIPSPYRYSAVVEVLVFDGNKFVVWFETRHKHYEVFALSDAEVSAMSDADTAEAAHVAN